MKLDGALKGGITGAATLGLLTETLGRINSNSSHFNLLQKGKLKKRLKKTHSKNGLKATKQYIHLAEDLLGSAAYLGIRSLSKKKNSMLTGGVLGTVTGLGNVFLNHDGDNKKQDGDVVLAGDKQGNNNLSSKILEVSLYTIGGLIAGKLVQNFKKRKKRKK